MRLSEFIEAHQEQILAEWVAFARTLLPWATGMTEKDLRDHAEELLTAVVADMESPQTRRQQAEKSKGRAEEGALGDIALLHAAERLKSGFTLDQLVAEYRALRASVLRLWGEAHGDKEGEITRFNEAVDETLGEAAAGFTQELTKTREQFLAILGHDLRNPLGAILMGAESLARPGRSDEKATQAARRIRKSAERMRRMIDDLLDLTRTRLGSGIPITPAPTNLKTVCEAAVTELEAVHPGRVRCEASGSLLGEWDSDRLVQVVSNLVANALQHGPPDAAVTVVLREQRDGVELQVHNTGSSIPAETLQTLFEPMVRGATPNNATGLGLGLYIAREVVTAHGGTIGVASTDEDGTTFTVRLPRRAPGSSAVEGAQAAPTAELEADADALVHPAR